VPGFTVGGYHLLARIGEGGMGVVHLGQRPGGRRVALKVLRPHVVGDDEARARLAREVNSLSRIRSVGVAEIVDADPWGDIPYVATRYVPGLSLHDHVREVGPITGPDLTWFAIRLAEALSAVHGYGVLHRDVKPSNVLMEGRTPILIDFGLARVADDPRLTHTGWLLGTPGYLAPEILFGEDATSASDVHSWGATVAFAGLGRPPFGRGPAMAIMDRVRRGEHELDGLPRHLRSVIVDALAPEPSCRPPLTELLRRLRTDESPSLDRRPSVGLEDDWSTAPLAAAAAMVGADDVTRAGPTDRSNAPPPTLVQTMETGQGHQPAPWTPWTRWSPPVPPPAPPVAVRARRWAFLLSAAWAGGAAIAAYPYLGTLFLLTAAWLLRSGSLAAGAASNRRLVRGRRRWYDGPQLLLATPWHLLQSIAGTLVLALWGLGLATAAALLGYAVGIGLSWTLLACGITFAASLWFGPGGRRVRGPLAWVVRPATSATGPWLVSTAALLAVALAATYTLGERGPDWAPAQDHLFAGLSTSDLLPDGLG